MNADQLFQLYDDTLRGTLDDLVPLHKVKTRICNATPWFDDECRAIKRHVRLLERRYRRTRGDADRLAWVTGIRDKHQSFKEKENQYWEGTVRAHSADPKKLWNSVSTILGKTSSRSAVNTTFSATDFLSFMEKKVETVRLATAGAPPPEFTRTESSFESFEVCTPTTVERVIRASASKTCELDPAPSFLVKDFLDVILPFVARMCNTSIQEGSLPASQKRAIVTPALKKHDLDCTDVKNYRPISNLTFMSKIVEKLVLAQLSTYLVENNLFPKFQSGFRKFHSTESALLRVMSDICSAIDKGHVALLSLLDVSAAFDTVDHAILLERLSTSCGLAGPACSWIGSFITGRTQSVHLAGTRSPWADVRYGIPQGSVLGPVLYVLYTADIAKIIESLGFQVHLYADDVQLYASCVPTDSVQLSQRVLLAIETIGTWMSSNRLRLNPDKTQYIWFGTRQRLKNRDIRGLTALSSSLVETSSVRDLGVILDSELTMEEHVIKLCQTCFFHLRRIRSVRRSLTSQALNTLVHAFISSRIDFCNGVLCGISGYLIDRLQSVLNSSARLVLNIRKYDHISAALRDNLHWLPIHQRVQFKICLFVRSCLVGAAPTYLAESCRYVRSATGRQNLRSAARGDLIGPPWRLKGYGYRGFSVAGPRLWNALPSDVRNLDIGLETFKKNLKTYFMRQP
jgi:hypothetical protein